MLVTYRDTAQAADACEKLEHLKRRRGYIGAVS